MTFVVLAMAILAVFPLSLILKSGDQFTGLFWTVFGALPFLANVLPAFDIGIISWAGEWVGFVYGLEVTVVDFFAVAALLSFSGQRGPVPLWCKLPVLIYIGAAALSMFQAVHPLAAFFGVWQFMRMFIVMIAVTLLCIETNRSMHILTGMALGMGCHLLAVLYQRYGLGLTQAHGLFIHQNTLGMAAHVVLFPFLALLLHAFPGLRKQLFATLGTLLVVLFTASRAAVGLSAFGVMTLYAVLALAGLTGRKMLFATLAVAGLALIAPIAISAFDNRFEAAPLREAEYDERAAFNQAATLILEDHPWGIGVNHYVKVARDEGYSERAGVAAAAGNRRNIVHNAYLMVAAESGYLGLVAFCVMLAVPLVTALSMGWRFRAMAEGSLLTGLGVTLLMIYLHSFFEWVLFAKEVQYLLFMTMGMIFGVTLRLRSMAHRASTNSLAFSVLRSPMQMPR